MFKLVVHHFLATERNLTIHWSNGETELLSHEPLPTYCANSDLQSRKPPYYWCPSSNFPGVDAAIITTNYVFGIQATMQSTHGPPTEGLRKLRTNLAQGSPHRRLVTV